MIARPTINIAPLTPEQQAALDLQRETQQKKRQEEAAERERVRLAAEEKSKALLVEHLTPAQVATLEAMAEIAVKSITGKSYKLKGNQAWELGEDGNPIASLCIQPNESIPHYDAMLAKKLMIETNEPLFIRTAVRSEIRH